MGITKFKDNKDPGYQSICAFLHRQIRDYEEFIASDLGSTAATTPEETSRSRSPWLPNYIINNSGGGMIIQETTFNAPSGTINIGR
jgi:hypothetical protein